MNNQHAIKHPRYKGKDISQEMALEKLKELIKQTPKEEMLYYKNGINSSLYMNEYIFNSLGATIINSKKSDVAWYEAIIEGRGKSVITSPKEIEKSEVVIVWGGGIENYDISSFLNKTLIVIDPIKTQLAQKADLHIQIRPQTDIYLALLLSRFLYINGAYDEDFLEEHASEYEDFYEFTQTIRIKSTLELMDISLGELGNILELITDKKLVIISGNGILKYKNSIETIRAIDAFGVMLGLFVKEGCGVIYKEEEIVKNLFAFYRKSAKVSDKEIAYKNYTTVFIQDENQDIKEPITNIENIVYFGLNENKISKKADLVIPVCKDSIYGMSYTNCISDYELSDTLAKSFDIELQENFVFNGFHTDENEFIFIDEIDNNIKQDESLFLITLNKEISSSRCSEFLYLNSRCGFVEDEEVRVSLEDRDIKIKIKIDEMLRDDCAMVYNDNYPLLEAIKKENKIKVIKL